MSPGRFWLAGALFTLALLAPQVKEYGQLTGRGGWRLGVAWTIVCLIGWPLVLAAWFRDRTR